MDWDACSGAFEIDGSLRDIYFQETTSAEWDKLLDFVRGRKLDATYLKDGAAEPVPVSAESIVEDSDHSHCLKINLAGTIVASHFFTDEEIEMDIDPREVVSQRELDIVLNFMRELGAHLKRNAILTEENSPQHILFEYSFHDDQLRFVPPNF